MVSKKVYDNLDKVIQRLLNKNGININKLYKEHIDQIKLLVAEVYEKYGQSPDQMFGELMKYGRIDKLDEEIKTIVRSLNTVAIKSIRTTLSEVYRNVYKTTFDLVVNETKLVGIQRSLKAMETVNQINMGMVWTDRFKNYNDRATYEIIRTTREGIYRGDSYQTISKALTERIEVSEKGANVIARTEGKRVYSEAQTEVVDQFKGKVQMVKIWETSKDERVRSKHKKMQGQTVDYEDMFTLPDGTKTFAPGQTGKPEHDIHERCYMRIEVK